VKGSLVLVRPSGSVGSVGTFWTCGEAVGSAADTVTDGTGAAVAVTEAATGDSVMDCTGVEVAGAEGTVTGAAVGENVIDCAGVEASEVGAAAAVAIGAGVVGEVGDGTYSDVGCAAGAAP
jgi:hypothetical protein